MRHVGERALPFRLAALDDKGLTLIYPVTFLGRWVVLSFVSSLEESDSVLWKEQGRRMKELGASLLVAPLEAKTLYQRGFHSGAAHSRWSETRSAGSSVSMGLVLCCPRDAHEHFS